MRSGPRASSGLAGTAGARAEASAAATLARQGAFGGAISRYRAALDLDPGFAEAHNNLGNLYLFLGGYRDAARHYARSLECRPDFHQAHSNLLILRHYAPGATRKELHQAHRQWAARHAGSQRARFPLAGLDLSPDRPLRVGYVSADIHAANPVPLFIEPLLAAHDPAQFQIFVYSNSPRRDAVTARLHRLSPCWRRIDRLSEREAADRIRRDRIDILVDLSGHFAGNRLLLFALRPAPVQVSYLGYPDTTGLDAMDYRITDRWADPPGAADRFSVETLVRLPHSYFCFAAPRDGPRPAPAPPCPRHSSFTFGSFNYRPKITPAVVSAWAAILRRTRGSRLLLHRKDLDFDEVRTGLAAQFAREGVGADRLRFEDRRARYYDHLALYREVDLALDTFPYNGATTTCEALWMGVPVVSLRGSTHAGRVGWSLLSSVGLGDWAAGSPADYVETAVRAARHPERLAAARAGLRGRLEQAPLTRPDAFTAALEACYRAMWHRFVKGLAEGRPAIIASAV